MFKRFFSIFVSVSMGLLASAAVLALTQHPAGTAWAAPETKPLATVLTLGGTCGLTIQDCIDAAGPGEALR